MNIGDIKGGRKSQGTVCGRAELREAVLPAGNICEGLLKQNKQTKKRSIAVEE